MEQSSSIVRRWCWATPVTRPRPLLCALLVAFVALSLVRCAQPLPQEPGLEEGVTAASLGSKVVVSEDGIWPDTVAFLARIFDWDGASALNYEVTCDSSTLVTGAVDRDQVQVVFAVDPAADLTLHFAAWGTGTDTTHAEWVSKAGRGG